MKNILKEPLVHFLVLGALLYLYYALNEVVQSSEIVLNISPYEIQQIESNYEKEFSKKASKEYLNAILEKKYYEKVLLSEAQTLQIAMQDAQISQLILKKMEFILANATEVIEPSEEELHEYYKKNIQEYSEVKSLSFVRVHFLDEAKAQESFVIVNLFEANVTLAEAFTHDSSLQILFENMTKEQVKEKFGNYFASKLFMIKSAKWHQAIPSVNGLDMVYITGKSVAEALAFDEVQDRVYSDYMSQKREQVKRDAYKKLATQYKFQTK